uniref:Prenylcysteine lyase domain-containing protein n=2 Tax=Timema TaxID=61471 RepID=A0A7R9JNL0_TIMGE|nr:unnamed protein product [Timema genevievae]
MAQHYLKLLFFYSSFFHLFNKISCVTKVPKIAIIGGGIGGTSAAFFIHDLFGSNGAQIDLYESNRIGGRLAMIEVNNQKYEAGGSILHPRNKYMEDFVKLFGLKKRINDNFRYGMYDGEEFVFTESQWEIMNYIKLVWRYGLGPLKLQNYIDDILTRFERSINEYGSMEQCYAHEAALKNVALCLVLSEHVQWYEDHLKSKRDERKRIVKAVAIIIRENICSHWYDGDTYPIIEVMAEQPEKEKLVKKARVQWKSLKRGPQQDVTAEALLQPPMRLLPTEHDTLVESFIAIDVKKHKIYKLQKEGVAYNTVQELIGALSPQFVEEMKTTTLLGLKEKGFSDRIVDELVTTTLTANYGQNASIHEFVGSVSVAGAGGGLWAVHGGNRLVPERLLESSKATLYKARVARVQLLNDTGGFVIESTLYREVNNNIETENNTSDYDIVIVAAPLTEDTRRGIEFSDFPVDFSFPGEYHRTVCTMVHGKINHTWFGFKDESDMLDGVLTTKLGLQFNSLGKQNPVDYSSKTNNKANKLDVWKIFAQTQLQPQFLSELFSEIKEVTFINWLAYPHYEAKPRLDQFVLFENLYHINAIEWAASAMEMSIIGAKNVALLVYNKWYDLKVDDSKKSHEEL